MKKDTRNIIILFVFAIVVGLAMNSCGARKSEKSRNSDSSKTELSFSEKEIIKEEGFNLSKETEKENTNVKEESAKAVDDKNETVTEETNYEPADPTKPASIIDENGKETVLNNAKKTHKKTTQKNNSKTNETAKSEKTENRQSDKEVQAEQKKESERQKELQEKAAAKKAGEEIKIDRSAWSMWNWLWLLIPVGIIVIVWKNKTKIASWLTEKIWWV